MKRTAIALLVLASAALSLALASTASARPGDLDPTYGDHGFADWSGVNGVEGVGSYMALDDSGRLLTLAQTPPGYGPESSTAVTRTTPAGTPDASFGDGGAAVVGEPGWSGYGLAVQPDGRILALLGQDGYCPTCRFLLYRLLPDGQIDPTLDGVEVPIGAKYSSANLQVDPSGRILVPGYSGILGLTSEGEVDPTFGDGGTAMDGSIGKLVPDPTGGYLVGRMAWWSNPNPGINVTKIDGDGNIVGDWGSGGTASLGGPSIQDGGDDFALAASPSGRVAIGDYEVPSRGGGPEADLWVLDSAGKIASDFDPAPATDSRLFGGLPAIHGLAWDASERLLVTGSMFDFDGYDVGIGGPAFIARFQAGGSPDQSFAAGGVGRFPGDFSTLPISGGLRSILVQPDGQILADAAPTWRPTGTGFPDFSPTVARFLAAPGGPNDADADGVIDSADGCPRRAAENPDGCQRASVAIDLQRTESGFRGTLEADRTCRTDADGLEERQILLYREDDGEDQVVAGTRIKLGDKAFRFGRQPRGHTYYAQLPEMLQPGVVVCPEARSAPVVLLALELDAAKRIKASRNLHARARCEGLGCKLSAQAVVELRRPDGKDLTFRSRLVKRALEAGEQEQLNFELGRRDAERLKRLLRGSRQARKHSQVVFKATAQAAGQTARAAEQVRLR